MRIGDLPLNSQRSTNNWAKALLHVTDKEKDMPKSIHVSLDGRSGARVREIDFDLTPVPVSTRTSKGLTITKWAVKEVTTSQLALK